MNIQIPCPHCGARPLQEFVYGEIPVVPDALTEPDARAFDRAFMHNNVAGVITERWFHSYGCRRWLTLRRDTRNDCIIAQ